MATMNNYSSRGKDILLQFSKAWLVTFTLLLLGISLIAQCPITTAYVGTNTTGNQGYGDRLGLNFTASAPFTVTQLSTFDSGQDGIATPIMVGIVRNDVPGTIVIPAITFTGTADPLVGGYRVRNIAPVTLPAGSYIIVAVGYSGSELNGNSNIGGYPTVTTNSGGVLTFTDSSYGGTGFGKPSTIFVTPGAFHAGSFSFVVDTTPPTITCPNNITMDTDDDRCSAVVCFAVNGGDNCAPFLPTTLAGHTYLGTFGGHTYFTSNSVTNWEGANSAATALGGHLLSINSAIEQSDLSGVIPNGLLQQFFIGLRYSPSLDAFKWTSGEPVTYTNWGIGQPNTGFLSSDYVFHWDSSLPGLRKWYNTLSNIPRRYIVEFEGYPVTLVSGTPSGSIFLPPTTNNVYKVTDIAGNMATCSFTVTVVDNQNPVFQCPTDFTVQAEKLNCGAGVLYEFELNDNCGANFVLTEGLASGEEFPLGETDIVYIATDDAGNTAECSFTVTVLDYINPSLGCKPIQISLDVDCVSELTPTMVLTGFETGLGCLDNFIINVRDGNMDLGPNVTIAQVGKTLNYSITNEYGFSCWNTVKIEDKIAPTIECEDVTVPCLTDLSTVGIPDVNTDCSETMVLVSEIYNGLSCDPSLVGSVTRTWQAKDKAGNLSLPCISTISLLRSSVVGVSAPANKILKCSAIYAVDNNNNPQPSVTGVPMLGTTPLYPLAQLNMQYCNSTIDYKDEVVLVTPCKKIINRTWRIVEWHCSTAEIKFISTQRIDIIDDIAPIITSPNDTIYTTSSQSCSASVKLPKVKITDNCNTIARVWINIIDAEDDTPIANINTNGGIVEIPTGEYNVEYNAIDACNNASKISYTISVVDKTDPVAICDQFNTVSINSLGYTDITAASINNGSFDECSEVKLQIRRMEDPCGNGANIGWHDSVSFCCADANQGRMVQLLVTDAGGKTNICMISVNVQEKLPARIICPRDTVVENCTFIFDVNNSSTNFGVPTIIDNCIAANSYKETVKDDRTNCGTGTLSRTFTLIPAVPNNGICVQQIKFENNDPFYINREDNNDPNDDVIWPKDYVAYGKCSLNGVLPEMLPDSSSRPKFTEDICDIAGSKYVDQTFPFTSNGACFKIIRTWSIIDWCQPDDETEFQIWTYEQVIKIIDNEAPRITSAITKREVCTLDCTGSRIELRASATDCTPTPELVWNYVITKNGDFFQDGVGNNATDTFPLGLYHIKYEVADKCGNISSTEYDFEIKSCKAPTARCADISVGLTRVASTIQKVILPSDLDIKSSHACGLPVNLAFSANGTLQSRTFTCADKNKVIPVSLYVFSPNGQVGICTSNVTVTDLSNLCPTPPGLLSDVSGQINTENGKEVSDVAVVLSSVEPRTVMSDIAGNYMFSTVPNGSEYIVIPSKDGDDIKGVTTLDLVMIQRHILGIDLLKSPYQLIAADVDGNHKVSATDLIDMRKLILGITPQFVSNTSWRFVDKSYIFNDSTDPLSVTMPEKYLIENLSNDMTVDFVGIKIGDVNQSATNLINNTVVNRNQLSIGIDDRMVNIGDVIQVDISALEAKEWFGLQTDFKLSNVELLNIIPGIFNINGDAYFVNDNILKIVYPIGEGITSQLGDKLFTIHLRAKRSGKLSEMLSLGADKDAILSVDNNLITAPLQLSWRTMKSGFRLFNASPNPWITVTSIGYEVPTNGTSTLTIVDLSGKQFLTRHQTCQAGMNEFLVNRSDIGPAGVYIYEVTYGDQKVTGKMILMD